MRPLSAAAAGHVGQDRRQAKARGLLDDGGDALDVADHIRQYGGSCESQWVSDRLLVVPVSGGLRRGPSIDLRASWMTIAASADSRRGSARRTLLRRAAEGVGALVGRRLPAQASALSVGCSASAARRPPSGSPCEQAANR